MEIQHMLNSSGQILGESFFEGKTIPPGYYDRASTFARDPRVEKLDLCAGVVRDSWGDIASFPSVVRALQSLVVNSETHGYPSPLGNVAFCEQVRKFYLSDNTLSLADRSFSIQTIGAAQATRLLADCLSRLDLCETVAISKESWADHKRIFERAGIAVRSYPYLTSDGANINFTGLVETIRLLPENSAVLLQTSCHNPTGRDLSSDQRSEVFSVCKECKLLPILDAAYIGFGDGIEQDLAPIKECVKAELDFFITGSCCKTFSLYDARVGALTAVLSDSTTADLLKSQLRAEVQANHSSPPRLYAELIAQILTDSEKSAAWRADLERNRLMIVERREKLVDSLFFQGAGPALLSIADQKGIFAWTGFSKEQCKALTKEFGIYLPSNGRICISAIPEDRIESVARALAIVEKL